MVGLCFFFVCVFSLFLYESLSLGAEVNFLGTVDVPSKKGRRKQQV